MEAPRTHFRLCSSCKKPLPFSSAYFRCSVTTCNRPRTELTFCSLGCFEAHVPVVRHREAWAEEARAPSRAEWEEQQAEEEADERQAAGPPRPAAPRAPAPRAPAPESPRPERRIVGAGQKPAGSASLATGAPREILIIASKLKSYIRARSGMNTSESALDVLSDIVRELCDAAIQKAAADGRKTVMDRDF